jgi:hypothetical protein
VGIVEAGARETPIAVGDHRVGVRIGIAADVKGEMDGAVRRQGLRERAAWLQELKNQR